MNRNVFTGHGFTQLKKESCNVWEQNIWGKMAIIGVSLEQEKE